MKSIKVLILILPILCIGCSDSGDTPTGSTGGTGTTTMSFATDVRPIIQSNNCLNSGCHGTGSSAGGLALGTATYANVIGASGINGAIVVDSSASTSNLYLKVTASPPFGSRMPASGSFLTTTEQNKIRDWINQGALDN